MKFEYLKGDCPICNGERKDCRKSTRTQLIHCRSTSAPVGFDTAGEDSQGFTMYKVAEAPQNVDRANPMPMAVRDTQYRDIRSFLTNPHRAKLRDRGLTDAQIDWLHEQGWIRSWEPGQSTKADRGLAGIDPKTGKTLGCKGIAIAAVLDGKITGYQIANDDRESAKYIWLSSGNKASSGFDKAGTPHLPNGDLPLAVWQHPEIEPTEAIVCEGFLKSLITAIQLWQLGQTQYLVIGAAGGNFGASGQTLREVFRGHDIQSVLLAPDAGAIANPQIMKAYDRAKSLCVGRDFNVLWWGQESKADKDIDELSPKALKSLAIIPWAEFCGFAPTLEKEAADPVGGKKNMMDMLQAIFDRCELWQTEEGDAWVDVPRRGYKEPMLLESDKFRRWLAKSFFEAYGYRCKPDAINQVLMTCAGFAEDEATYQLHHRVASHEGKIYIDLGTPDRSVVEICGAGWRILTTDCPVKFRRPASMKPLPIPAMTPDWSGLRKILNLEESDWVLLLTWLSWGLHPDRPHPLLVLNGEHGTGKSKTSELLKRLIDPAKALLMSLPREERNLKAHASNRWCLVYDNLSGLSGEMSDALCRLATGGGLVDRALYTDTEESVFDGVRPIILNGIEALATRPDLLDRSIILNLKPIGEEQRMTEESWEGILAECQASVFACLLNAVAQGMRLKINLKPLHLSRMADFHVWGHAVEGAFGFEAGTFEAAYQENRGLVHQTAIDNDAIATAILQLCETRDFTGTASDLLKELSDIVSEGQRKAPDWIKSPRVLGKQLIRLAPELRRCGITVKTGMRVNGLRLITLEKMPEVEAPPPTEVLDDIEEEIFYEFEAVEEEAPPEIGQTVTYKSGESNLVFTVAAIDGETCTIQLSIKGKPVQYCTHLDWLKRSQVN